MNGRGGPVTVLVDGPRWWWRGQRWAHLCSDRSLAELHEFAGALGLRRLAFQGDHYDVPEPIRARALELGAVAVDSRELLRRLRAAGLRRNPRRRPPPWEPVVSADPGAIPDLETLAGVVDRAVGAGAGSSLADTARPLVGWWVLGHAGVTVLARPGELALMLELAPDGTAPDTHDRLVQRARDIGSGARVTADGHGSLIELHVETS